MYVLDDTVERVRFFTKNTWYLILITFVKDGDEARKVVDRRPEHLRAEPPWQIALSH